MANSPSRPFHWPGGILPEVRLDPNGDIKPDEVKEEAKGWLLFVTERWVSREAPNIPDHDGDYEVRQRRTLVETWAKADQQFRDSYHQRAPPGDALAYPEPALRNVDKSFPPHDRFMCLAPLSRSYRSNRSKWIKLCILSYRLDGEMEHCLETAGSSNVGVDPNPATFPDPSTFQITDFLPWLILEMANFAAMTMTKRGTVLFTKFLIPWFLVD
ncbi:conserved hypothetical protein [Talaromyces stipitatus ATCC 10500]|uniref:Uncharacterized protein n=1 Tax=Talaromyces stipitatus (strain ATCC 10500 / CBS 375.48 / QM 6759 / NRRL 1006) TaxID=441959 RepID=B8M1K0_TALSN|nr:uncharacterized protein TSTA_093330 [Talaromyces stipitatus ATCC 10500]EED22087.1 conserved hypothetical protein [Talaromyces stipitatus ATCC 10500]